MSTIGVSGIAVVLLGFGIRVSYLCALYFSGDPGAKRFEIETGVLWFVGAALVLILFRTTPLTDEGASEFRRRTGRECVLWVISAAVLYWPALGFGFLSDDFVLADRAYRLSFGSLNAEAFRPLPLVVWSVILHAGGGPTMLRVAWFLVGLLMQFALRSVEVRSRELFCAMGVWTLIGTAPALTFFFVAPDLQNSRYLYLSAIGWSGLLVAMGGQLERQRINWCASAATALTMISTGVYGVRRHQQPWREAASVRNVFEHAAANDARLLTCPTVVIRNAPDSVRGAYVLRNGAVEALKRDVGFAGEAGPAAPRCTFLWDSAGSFRASND